MSQRWRPSTYAVLLALAFLSAGPVAAEPANRTARIELKDGRTVVGNIDTRSDSDGLWLRRTEPGIVLRSRIALDDISHISFAGRTYESRDFARLVEIAATRGPGYLELSPAARPDEPLHDQGQTPARLSSLQIAATPGQWDTDPHIDGLALHVLPLDQDGHPAAADGLLEVSLHGQKTHRGWAGRLPGQPEIIELERWSIRVRPDDFEHGEVTYRLAYDRFHPEVDVDISPAGLVHARLGVTGEGVLETSIADVWLRPISEFRDNLQLYHGERWLPVEREPAR